MEKKGIGRVRSLIREGRIRKIVIKDQQGKPQMEIPLALGFLGAAITPILIAVGAMVIGALATKGSIIIEREEKSE